MTDAVSNFKLPCFCNHRRSHACNESPILLVEWIGALHVMLFIFSPLQGSYILHPDFRGRQRFGVAGAACWIGLSHLVIMQVQENFGVEIRCKLICFLEFAPVFLYFLNLS